MLPASSPERLELQSNSPRQTEQLGQHLGKLLASGDVVTLSGELGGGKTCFARGVVTAMSPENAGNVASPTFAILNEYSDNITIYHYDCYRLHGVDDALELGLDEQLEGTGVCLIEWPDRISALLPKEHLAINFGYVDDQTRAITLQGYGERGSSLLQQLQRLVRQENHTKKKL